MSKILYLGPYFTEDIVSSRRLPARNPACFMRMRRFSEAFISIGHTVLILSPGIMAGVRRGRPLFLRTKISRSLGKIELFTFALGIPLLGYAFSSIFTGLQTIRLIENRKPKIVIFYNFDPATLLSAVLAKARGVDALVLQLEDIPLGLKSFWVKSDEVGVMRETISYLLFHIGAALCEGVIMPTGRFAASIPCNKPFLVNAACNEISLLDYKRTSDNKLTFIFAGKLEAEHGIVALMGAIRLVAKNGLRNRCRFFICGRGPRTSDIQSFHREINDEDFVSFRGFVSDHEYLDLLNKSDVGLALQDPAGLYGRSKTPSKAYEFISHGKILVATDVGDLSKLPRDFVLLCPKVDESMIFNNIKDLLSFRYEQIVERKIRALDYAQGHCSFSAAGKRMDSFISGLNRHCVI